MVNRRAKTPLEIMRARAKGDRMAAAVRALPREKKREIWDEIQNHAPDLVDWFKKCNASPQHFRVRDGDGWRDVVTPEIVHSHVKGNHK